MQLPTLFSGHSVCSAFASHHQPFDEYARRDLAHTIEHLHHVHGYPLLRSTEGTPSPVHDDDLFLPPHFRYHDDVVLEAKYKPALLQEHRVTLVDRRRMDVRRRSANAIGKAYGIEVEPPKSKRRVSTKGASRQSQVVPGVDMSNGESSCT